MAKCLSKYALEHGVEKYFLANLRGDGNSCCSRQNLSGSSLGFTTRLAHCLISNSLLTMGGQGHQTPRLTPTPPPAIYFHTYTHTITILQLLQLQYCKCTFLTWAWRTDRWMDKASYTVHISATKNLKKNELNIALLYLKKKNKQNKLDEEACWKAWAFVSFFCSQ